MLYIYPVGINIFSFAKVLPKDQAEIQKLNKEVELLRVSICRTTVFYCGTMYSINAIQVHGYLLNTCAQSILSIVTNQSQVSHYVCVINGGQPTFKMSQFLCVTILLCFTDTCTTFCSEKPV